MSAAPALERNRTGNLRDAVARTWYRCEGPTWCIVVAIYGGWFALLRYHGVLPWWVILPVGAWLAAWYGSLRHETIHSLRSVPRALRIAIASVPFGSFYP